MYKRYKSTLFQKILRPRNAPLTSPRNNLEKILRFYRPIKKNSIPFKKILLTCYLLNEKKREKSKGIVLRATRVIDDMITDKHDISIFLYLEEKTCRRIFFFRMTQNAQWHHHFGHFNRNP
jgi:hypothetical protein